jgi:hypothetical protein
MSMDGELPEPLLQPTGVNNDVRRQTPQQFRLDLLIASAGIAVDLAQRGTHFTTFRELGGLDLLYALLTSEDQLHTTDDKARIISLIRDLKQAFPRTVGEWSKGKHLAAIGHSIWSEMLLQMQNLPQVKRGGLAIANGAASPQHKSASVAAASQRFLPIAVCENAYERSRLASVCTRGFEGLCCFWTPAEYPALDSLSLIQQVLSAWTFMQDFRFTFDTWNSWVFGEFIGMTRTLMEQHHTDAAIGREREGEESATISRRMGEFWQVMIDQGFMSLMMSYLTRFAHVNSAGWFWAFRDAMPLLLKIAAKKHALVYRVLDGMQSWATLQALFMRYRRSMANRNETEQQLVQMFLRLHEQFRRQEFTRLHVSELHAARAENVAAEGVQRIYPVYTKEMLLALGFSDSVQELLEALAEGAGNPAETARLHELIAAQRDVFAFARFSAMSALHPFTPEIVTDSLLQQLVDILPPQNHVNVDTCDDLDNVVEVLVRILDAYEGEGLAAHRLPLDIAPVHNARLDHCRQVILSSRCEDISLAYAGETTLTDEPVNDVAASASVSSSISSSPSSRSVSIPTTRRRPHLAVTLMRYLYQPLSSFVKLGRALLLLTYIIDSNDAAYCLRSEWLWLQRVLKDQMRNVSPELSNADELQRVTATRLMRRLQDAQRRIGVPVMTVEDALKAHAEWKAEEASAKAKPQQEGS